MPIYRDALFEELYRMGFDPIAGKIAYIADLNVGTGRIAVSLVSPCTATIFVQRYHRNIAPENCKHRTFRSNKRLLERLKKDIIMMKMGGWYE